MNIMFSGLPQVESGDMFSLYLSPSGTVYSFGSNYAGQLGHGDIEHCGAPTKIEFFLKRNIRIRQIKCSPEASFFVTSKREIYCCGRNSWKQLGFDDDTILTYHSIPTLQKEFLPGNGREVLKFKVGLRRLLFFDNLNIDKIQSGRAFSVVRTVNGEFYAMGSNAQGQLGLGRSVDWTLSVKKISFFSTRGIRIRKFKCGPKFILFFAEDGKIYGVGGNSRGDMGLSSKSERKKVYNIEEISSLTQKRIMRAYNSCGVSFFMTDNRKTIFGCGDNSSKNLGLSTKLENKDGNIVIPTEIQISLLDGEKVSKIQSTNGHTFFMTSFGRIFGSGFDNYGYTAFRSLGKARIVNCLQRIDCFVLKKKIFQCTAYYDTRIFVRD